MLNRVRVLVDFPVSDKVPLRPGITSAYPETNRSH